jgi:hypothetical protein
MHEATNVYESDDAWAELDSALDALGRARPPKPYPQALGLHGPVLAQPAPPTRIVWSIESPK